MVRGALAGSRASRPQKRHEQDVGVRQTRRRVAGHPEERRAGHERESGRLSRPDRDAVKDHLASTGNRVDDEIPLADGAAA